MCVCVHKNYKDNNISFIGDDDDHLAPNIKSYKTLLYAMYLLTYHFVDTHILNENNNKLLVIHPIHTYL